jgi:rhodanese-related sulfurtransferase
MHGMALGQTQFDAKLKSLYRYTVPLVSATDLQRRLLSGEPIVLLDTRAIEEFNVSHLHGALFIDYKKFTTQQLDTLSRNTPIIVYCSVGYRSERVGEKLIAFGFKNVRNLYGGIFEWANKGYPLVDEKGRTTLHVHTYNKSWSQWLTKGVKVY